MDKKELRAQIRAKKRAMTTAQVEACSEKLAELFREHPLYKAAKSIYGYMPYNQEVRTIPIMRQAQADGVCTQSFKITAGYDFDTVRSKELRQITVFILVGQQADRAGIQRGSHRQRTTGARPECLLGRCDTAAVLLYKCRVLQRGNRQTPPDAIDAVRVADLIDLRNDLRRGSHIRRPHTRKPGARSDGTHDDQIGVLIPQCNGGVLRRKVVTISLIGYHAGTDFPGLIKDHPHSIQRNTLSCRIIGVVQIHQRYGIINGSYNTFRHQLEILFLLEIHRPIVEAVAACAEDIVGKLRAYTYHRRAGT